MNPFIVPIILVITSFATYSLVISPTWDQIGEVQNEVARYDTAINDAKSLVDQRDALLDRLNALPQADRDRLLKVLPDSVDNVRLALDIDAIASSLGVTLSQIDVAVSQDQASSGGEAKGLGDTLSPESEPYDQVDISFTVEATYQDFKAFIVALEKSLRLVEISEISFKRNDGDLYTFDVTLTTFWLRGDI
jgi:Tfp pilus assembly protein PilO